LKQEVSELQSQNEKILKEYKESQNKSDKMLQKLVKEKNELEKKYQEQNLSVESILSKQEITNKKVADKMDQVKGMQVEWKAKYTASENKINQLKEELKGERKKVKERETEKNKIEGEDCKIIAGLRRDVERLERELKRSISAGKDMKAELKEHAEHRKRIQKDLNQINAQHNKDEKEIEMMSKDLRLSSEKYCEKQETIKKLKSQIKSQKDMMSKEYVDMKNKYKQQIASLEKESEANQHIIIELNGKIEKLQAEKKIQDEEMKSMLKMTDQLENVLEKSRIAHGDTKDAHMKHIEELHKKHNDKHLSFRERQMALQSEINELTQELEEVIAERDAYREMTEKEIERLSMALTGHKDKYDAHKAEWDEDRERMLGDHSHEKGILENQVHRLSKESESMIAHLSRLEKEKGDKETNMECELKKLKRQADIEHMACVEAESAFKREKEFCERLKKSLEKVEKEDKDHQKFFEEGLCDMENDYLKKLRALQNDLAKEENNSAKLMKEINSMKKFHKKKIEEMKKMKDKYKHKQQELARQLQDRDRQITRFKSHMDSEISKKDKEKNNHIFLTKNAETRVKELEDQITIMEATHQEKVDTISESFARQLRESKGLSEMEVEKLQNRLQEDDKELAVCNKKKNDALKKYDGQCKLLQTWKEEAYLLRKQIDFQSKMWTQLAEQFAEDKKKVAKDVEYTKGMMEMCRKAIDAFEKKNDDSIKLLNMFKDAKL